MNMMVFKKLHLGQVAYTDDTFDEVNVYVRIYINGAGCLGQDIFDIKYFICCFYILYVLKVLSITYI